MAKSKNATKLSSDRDRVRLRSALDNIETAAQWLRAARGFFGEDEGGCPDVASVSLVVIAGKESIAKGIEKLLSLNVGSPADDAATKIVTDLYDTFDLVLLVCAALKSPELPHGDGMTICPLAGSLSVIIQRMEVTAECICDSLEHLQMSPLTAAA